MKRFVLFVFNLNQPQMESIIECVSLITKSKFVKFKVINSNILLNFETDYDFNKVKQFMEMSLSDISNTYFISEFNDSMSVVLPKNETEQFLSLDTIPENQEIDSILEEQILDEITENGLDALKNFINYEETIEEEEDYMIFEPQKKQFKLDDILDKINEQGINSLTNEEKNFLKNFYN